jgi:hypothetical protein
MNPLMPVLQAVPYQGRADHVWPPFTEGWVEVPFHHDAAVVGRAKALLGSLPAYHYADEAMGSGLYRFFAFDTPIGEAIGALKFIGAEKARALMGDSPSAVAEWIDNNPTTDGGLVQLDGSAVPEDNSSVTGDGTGNAGVTVTPVKYATLNDAASAMNSALKAHGYVRTDQPIYAGFQLMAGDLTVDAFPGTNTINRLKGVLTAMGVTFASVPVYPWHATTTGGLTGIAAYDGTNAPTWAQWTGSGSAAPATTAKASTGTGLAVAGLAALAVGTIAVVAKSSGGLSALI